MILLIGNKIKSLSSGQFVGLPSRRGLQACAGGSVTGAVHPTNMSGIAKYLIIREQVIISHYIVYHYCNINCITVNYPIDFSYSKVIAAFPARWNHRSHLVPP